MATRDTAPNDSKRSETAANGEAETTVANNVLRPVRKRVGTQDARVADADEPNRSPRQDTLAPREQNSIRPTKSRTTARPAQPDDSGRTLARANGQDAAHAAAAPTARRTLAPPKEAETISDAIPEEVRRRFVQVGRKYYFPDGARAFTDRGKRLTTPSENTEVIRSLVTIAQARGWGHITVSGTERFRKEAWFAAKLAGLDVRGYKASDFEHEHLVRIMSRKSGKQNDAAEAAPDLPGRPDARPRADESAQATDGKSRASAREHRGSLIIGRLADHARAAYQHDIGEPMSYFVKLETARGERTIWGVDLERAFRESLTKPQAGDEIGLRAVRQDPVTVKTQERDPEGRVLGQRDLATHRNRWIVEKRAFFEERKDAARALRDPTIEPKRAVQEHPALVGTYLNLHAAELAAKQFRDPEDQQRFVGIVRNALADAVARGEPLPPVRLREPSVPAERPASRSPRVPERDRAPARG